ncbi:MAG: UvrD-helicase domain-containing protein [Candidatus Latescibacteria bacterium]|nr:UvrD-helicase domain-containing protein [Candidatus Latescibacterota bacterium]
MPIRFLDTEQKHAATSNGGEVVISAGAGSGKTRLLVGRYLYLLKTRHIPVQSIVAITFTNKASDQMKARIAQTAYELAETDDKDRSFWLDEVAAKVHTAPISTIHSFCNSILRSFPIEAGIDPLFTIIDATTLSALSRDAINGFITSQIENNPEQFDILIRTFGIRRFKRLLITMLAKRSKILKYLDENEFSAPSVLERKYARYIQDRINMYVYTLNTFHSLRPGDDSLALVLDTFSSGLNEISDMLNGDNMNAGKIGQLIDSVLPIGNKGSQKKWADRGISLSEVKGSIKECCQFLEMALTFNTYEKGVTSHIVFSLIEEFNMFEQYFLNLKKHASYLDHDDTLIETWRLLRNNVQVRQSVAKQYSHILVDEFQDTDGLQMDIIRMIAGNTAASLFTVGDPKQSIYRFRGADVAIFNEFAAQNFVDFKSLKLNYRSTSGVVDFVNHVFGRIMGYENSGNFYIASYSDMKSNRKTLNGKKDVQIIVFDGKNTNESRTEEAHYIARRMKELYENEEYSYDQMALIMRKGTKSEYYEKAFLAYGIPFTNYTQNNPFTSSEANDIGNLLMWLCNPEDPVTFTGLLLSPFFAVSADFLYNLKLRAGKKDNLPVFFLADESSVHDCREKRIRKVLRQLLALYERISIRELIEKAFDETDYTLTLLADPVRGEISLSILDQILDTADVFESKGGNVAEFSSLLYNGELISEENAAVIKGSKKISIISIHKAKGMEYKVVFLADISGRPQNTSEPLLLDDNLGFGIDIQDVCGNTIKTLVKHVALEQESLKDIAESKRLFYVGCTRAEDRLIITGTTPPKKLDDTFGNDNWMSWLHVALSITSEGGLTPESPGQLFEYYRQEVGGIIPDERESGTVESVISDTYSEPKEIHLHIPDYLLNPIPEIKLSGKPETLSPTQVMMYRECPACYLYQNIYGISGNKLGNYEGGMGIEYGNLAHAILQNWDFSSDIRSLTLVDNLAHRNIPENLRATLKKSLRHFTTTAIYEKISTANELHREESFVFIHDDVLFRGTIDLLLKTGNEYIIVDYKTDKVDQNSVDKAINRYKIQLGIYALALHRAKYIIPSQLLIYFITPAITAEIPCSEDFLAEMAESLTETINGIDSGNFAPDESEKCKVCPFTGLCQRQE